MKLDRNQNQSGKGKYALVNQRREMNYISVPFGSGISISSDILIDALAKAGYITFGNESPGEQFFVIKYKDKFTAGGLTGYAEAIQLHLHNVKVGTDDYGLLMEYLAEIRAEILKAQKEGYRIPD